MTEEDTFKRLKKITFNEMQHKWYATDINFITHPDASVFGFFKQYEWTWSEYLDEFARQEYPYNPDNK